MGGPDAFGGGMDRALLVGINKYLDAPLTQCVRDVERSHDGIQRLYGFNPRGIRVLADKRATTANILARLSWLVDGAKAGDRLLFHYSGHGTQVPTRGAGEADGLDEVICPVDFDWGDQHLIRDKDFARIFGAVPAGAEFVWISDSCHSGDLHRGRVRRGPLGLGMGLDLGPLGSLGLERWLQPPVGLLGRLRRGLGLRGAADGLNVALVSACADHEVALEGDDGGALSSALWGVLERTPHASLTAVVRRAAKRVKGQTPQLAGAAAICRAPFLWRVG